jgi:hypothetical protein
MVLDDDFISRIHRAPIAKKASDPPVVIIISSTLMGNP